MTMKSTSILVAALALSLLMAMANANIYTVVFMYAYAEGESRSCNGAAISCRLHEATTFALSNVEHFEDVALSDGWSMENKCNSQQLDDLHHTLEEYIAEWEAWLAEYGYDGYGRRGGGRGYGSRGGGRVGGRGYGGRRGGGRGRGRGSSYFRQLMEDRQLKKDKQCKGTCAELCLSGARSWCNCCKCCGNRRRLEEQTTNNLRGLQQLRIAEGVDLYLAAKEAAHYANQQLDNPLWARHLSCLEYNGLYQEKTSDEVTDDEEKYPWGQWEGGFNIEVLIVDEETGKVVSSNARPSDAPSDTPSQTPSDVPSDTPSKVPSMAPSDTPSINPSKAPSIAPSDGPSGSPTTTKAE